MFVALRDLRRAKGRFALITLVVVLVTVLVTFLSGLTAGLRHQNISALTALPGSSVVFADDGAPPSFDSSALTATQVDAWRSADPATVAVGIARTTITDARDTGPTPVAVFGIEGGHDVPDPGTVDLSEPVATDLGARPGDHVHLGGADLTVGRVLGDLWYAHSPTVSVPLTTWTSLFPNRGAATVLSTTPEPGTDPHTLAAQTATTIRSAPDAVSALPSQAAESRSLTLITALLLVISALVTGAFFMVWTVQRAADIAILKALGASTARLVVDALGQAGIVLGVGCGIGVMTTIAAGGVVGSIPFVVTVSTTLYPALATVGLGLLGAALAIRLLVTADPLTALGSNR